MSPGPTRILFAELFFPIGITSAGCGLSSVSVLVKSIAKRSLPTQKITRECWVAQRFWLVEWVRVEKRPNLF